MSHASQRDFCEAIRDRFPGLFCRSRALDIGSFDVNGNPRYLFSDSSVLGIDVADGPNVDMVCRAHELVISESELFHVVLCLEVLEHDRTWRETLRAIPRLVRPGGLVVMSCAGVGRREHGTLARGPQNSLANDWYENRTVSDVVDTIGAMVHFIQWGVEVNDVHHDVYFWGIRR